MDFNSPYLIKVKAMVIIDILSFSGALKILFKYRSLKEIHYLIKSDLWFDRLMFFVMELLHFRFIPLAYEFKASGRYSPFRNIQETLEAFSIKVMQPAIQAFMRQLKNFSKYEKIRIGAYLELLEKKRNYKLFEILEFLKSSQGCVRKPQVVLLRHSRWQMDIEPFFSEKKIKVDFYRSFLSVRPQCKKHYSWDYFIGEPTLVNKSFYSGVAFGLKFYLSELMRFYVARLMIIFNHDQRPNQNKFDLAAILPGYERTEWFNDLFWKRNSLSQEKILAILHGPFDDKSCHYGQPIDQWVSLHQIKSTSVVSSVYPFLDKSYPKILFRNVWILLKHLFHQKKNCLNWAGPILNLWITMSKIEALFKMTQPKVLWTSVEGTALTSLAACLALHRLGGVTVGTTWSLIEYPTFFTVKNSCDIVFIWGEHHRKMFVALRDVFMTAITSGYSGDFYFKNFLDNAKNMKEKLYQKQGERKIICFYDNLGSYDGIHNLTQLNKFFENLLDWIDRHEECLLVIKLKKLKPLNGYSGPKSGLLKKLENQNRVIMTFDKANLAPGFASHLILGLGLSTLASLLGQYGKDVILFDPNRFHDEWPLDLSRIRFIHDPNEIIPSLDGWIQEKGLSMETGYKNEIAIDSAPCRISSFLDSRSTERISNYVSNLLENLRNKEDAYQAIERTNMKYQSQWGKENILVSSSFGEDSF